MLPPDLAARYDRFSVFLVDATLTLVLIVLLTDGLVALGWLPDTASFVVSLPLVPISLYYLWFG